MSVIWKSIPGFNDKYLVSNDGRVYSLYVNKELKLRDHPDGYHSVTISRNKKNFCTYVHRLVAAAFICEPPFKNAEVNHKDGNKLNNTPDNLEWTTRAKNMQHLYSHLNGAATRPRGYMKAGRAKVPDEIVIQMRQMWKNGISAPKICKHFNDIVTKGQVYRICVGQFYTHISG